MDTQGYMNVDTQGGMHRVTCRYTKLHVDTSGHTELPVIYAELPMTKVIAA